MSMHLFSKEKIILICKLKSCWESYWLLFFIPSKSSTRRVSLPCCFPKVDSVFMVDFIFNIIWFIFIPLGHQQTLKKAVYDNYCSMAKLFNTLVRMSLMGILFNFVLSNTLKCKPGIHMYCNYLLTTKVTALQVVRTSFQHSFISGLPRPSYFSLPPMVLTLYRYMSIESFRSEFTANL